MSSLQDELSRHRQEHNPSVGAATCACGEWAGPYTMTDGSRSYGAHLEEVVYPYLREAWTRGMRTGTSRAMRMMSDEPGLALASEEDNPYSSDR